MRKLYSLLYISLIILFVGSSCSEMDDPIIKIKDKEPNKHKHVNDWIYENMVTSYLWNNDIPKEPDYSLKPDLFFESILSDKDKSKDGYRFSWIDDNTDSSEGAVSATNSSDIGFEYTRITYRNSNAQHFLVFYPKKGSDAYSKGIKRGNIITAVDGKDITNNNYKTILSGSKSKTLTIEDWVYNNQKEEYELTIKDITIKMESDFAESPVYLDSVYTINDKKIGYLVYNFFATGETEESHEYDEELMQTLANMKPKKNVEMEMVLDLRYNGGGKVSTAIALASALVKERSTENILAIAEYNDLLQKKYKKDTKNEHFIDYFIDKIEYKNGGKEIVVPALNLPRLYVLVSRYSASASEFVINGLKPYMDVILIGETTYGKNVGSWKIVDEKDTENNWSLQPITVKFYNSERKSDFVNGFIPDFEVDEFISLPFVEFGNTEDPLLGLALDLIIGAKKRSLYKSKQIDTYPKMIEIEGSSSLLNDRSRFEMYDDVRSKSIKSSFIN